MTFREFLEIASWIAGIAGTTFGVWAYWNQDTTPKTHIIENKPTDTDVAFIIGTWRDNKGGLDSIRVSNNSFQHCHTTPSLDAEKPTTPTGQFESIKISTVVQANGEWFILRTHPDGRRVRYSKEDNDRLRVDQTNFNKDIYYLHRHDE